ncbi:MAG: DUF2079 domain-containing protein [Anaerolineae bacterium]|nr:DUF2079 domain-containing protein [Anaerolineae bacterium]
MPRLSLLTPSKIPGLLLALLMLAYAGYFSWYSLHRHATLNSYAADLSLIDQPMWNTARGPGAFMELTWGQRQQPRLAEHFEPILLPLALLFFVWDDVRLLLIVQSLALALGALPVYWIARDQLRLDHSPFTIHHSQFTNWAALAFALVYLLFPHLQAANVADFHADPLVVAPLLFAFWYAGQKRWPWMWVWAVVAMAAKETLPTLTAMLGLFLLLHSYPAKNKSQMANYKSPLAHGLLLIVLSVVWFLGATFLIVAPLARQYFGTNGPIYFAHRYPGGPAGLASLLQDPARWQYLLGLFAAAGFLPLLAPELLLLGLPVLAANLLSNFPGQYSGEQHYSAPLVVAFVLAAIYGARRLVNHTSPGQTNRQSHQTTMLSGVVLWLLVWSLSYHALHGWTPLSIRTEHYAKRPAATRLPDFIRPIPPQAVVSASAAVHPHLAHRRVIYVFPTGRQTADYMLVDVTDIPGVHPADAHVQIMELLSGPWQLLQADQGLILAQNSLATAPLLPPAPGLTSPCSPILPLPCSFYDFARARTEPAHPVSLAFGDGRLQLVGYEAHDDPDDGVTFDFYWQTSGALPTDLRLWPLVYDDNGQLLSDPAQVPMIAPLWYPPAAWQPNEIIVTATLPQLLPDTFHLGLAAGPPDSFSNFTQRLPLSSSSENVRLQPGRWAQLVTFHRQGPFLERHAPVPTWQPLTQIEARFGADIRLTGYRLKAGSLRPGSNLSLLLNWQATQPPPADYTVFVHLLAPGDVLAAQHDAYPTWLTPQPTSQWPLRQPILDRHVLNLPPDLPPGVYTLNVGLYNAQTMARLALPDGGNAYLLAQIEIK